MKKQQFQKNYVLLAKKNLKGSFGIGGVLDGVSLGESICALFGLLA